MFIKQIKLHNFKVFDDADFVFDDCNVIKGKTGAGKSTIRDAILFALYNQTMSGRRDTDKFIKRGEEMCEVSVITDKHCYTRKRSGNQSQLEIDGEPVVQKEVALPTFEVFNTVFNVGHFMTLSERDRRQSILDQTPPVDRYEIYKTLGGADAWLDTQESLKDIPVLRSKINKRKKQLTEEVTAAESLLAYFQKFPFEDAKLKTKTDLARLQAFVISEVEKFQRIKTTKTFKLEETKSMYNIVNKVPIEEMKKKVFVLDKKLNDIFDSATLVLEEPYKSEMSTKDIFDIEVNGLRYELLSSGEKIKVDLAISQFFNSLLQEPIDCFFVDDAILIDELLEVPAQSFVGYLWPFELEIDNTFDSKPTA